VRKVKMRGALALGLEQVGEVQEVERTREAQERQSLCLDPSCGLLWQRGDLLLCSLCRLGVIQGLMSAQRLRRWWICTQMLLAMSPARRGSN